MHLSLLLDMAADGFGDRVVVGLARDGLTAERLRELAKAGARLLRQANADALLFHAPSGPAFPVALFAAAYARVPLVPINYRLGSEQINKLLANHPRSLGVGDPLQQHSAGRYGISWHTPDDWLSLAAQEVENPPGLEVPDSVAPAAIVYTSGTTSTPKGVVLRHDNLVAYVLGGVEYSGADSESAALMSVPPYHIAAVANVLTNLYAGRRLVMLENFSPEAWLDTVRSERITNAMVVPTMLARLMENGDGSDLTVPTLRTLAYGGARMPRRVIEAALREWQHVDFVNAYGLTETSSSVTVLGPEDHRMALQSQDPVVRARLESVGRAVPGVDIEVRSELGEVVPAGVRGLIWIRGAQVSGEYVGTGPAFDERSYFFTRDQGHLDEDGYLYLHGRIDDTIIRGAENIAPAEIEDVLLSHPDILDAVVIGIPDEEWGQLIHGAVVVKSGSPLTPEEVRQFVRSHLRSSKTPDQVTFWQELPRTVTGKIVRRDIQVALRKKQEEPDARRSMA